MNPNPYLAVSRVWRACKAKGMPVGDYMVSTLVPHAAFSSINVRRAHMSDVHTSGDDVSFSG